MQWERLDVPAGLTELTLADVSGPSGSLHKHCILTDFLKDNEIYQFNPDGMCLFVTIVLAQATYSVPMFHQTKGIT